MSSPRKFSANAAMRNGVLDSMHLDNRQGSLCSFLQVIVFDCDGVLFDSKEANHLFYNHILAYVDQPPVRPDQREYIHMHPVRESLGFLLGDGPCFERAWAYAQQIDFSEFNTHLRCEPGLVETLERIKVTFKTALATNRTVSTHELLRHYHLDKYFDLVVSASDVQFPKPHPETMERILTSFDVSAAEVLFIGDSTVDEALAKATGVIFAAYKNPKLKAHLHIDHFHQLGALLSAPRNCRTG